MAVLAEQQVHHLDAQQVLDLLETDSDRGLDSSEVQARQERFGPNAIPAHRERGPLIHFLLQFHQPLVYILLAAVVITAVFREWVDSGVILGVVLVNAVVGFLQESKAAKAIQALAKTTLTEARVMRAGEVRIVPSTELVPGDVVLLQSGDKVPADLRLFRIRDLQVDESALTGESLPVEKRLDALDEQTPLADRLNMAFTSTLVTYGQARGVVVSIGAGTEVGGISEMISTADLLQTPLTRKIAKFSRVLLVSILALAAFTFAVGLVRGEAPFDMFMAAVALAVGAIPEGLPAVVTITLAIGVARMARRRAIIRKLPAVETLGSTTTICSDKTGTLTVNQMTVREVLAGGVLYEVSGSGYDPHGEITPAGERKLAIDRNAAARDCLLAGLLCNDSTLVEKGDHWTVQGDPTEGGLIAAAQKAGFFMKAEHQRFPRIDSIPFESEYRYMATLHDMATVHEVAGGGRRMYAKGAIEVILAKCTAVLGANGETDPLDKAFWQAEAESMAARGLRVLGFAMSDLSNSASAIDHADVSDLTLVGLQAMIDPPRPEAVEAVSACREAGIAVKMITGDHALTARAIADQMGFYKQVAETGDESRVLTGRELAEYSDQDLANAVDAIPVFARVAPEQKLRLVRALQSRGHVVAVTGDGVNDAPALKQADIGVAMGLTGTEVAKEAADMVLTDDNFATIQAAVEEGRGVFDNLMKFIVWTLPTNLGEGLVILAALIIGSVLPILPVQILWINMTTAILLGMTLAFEPKEPDIMRRPPRVPDTPILTGVLGIRIVIVALIMLVGAFGAFRWALEKYASEDAARTVAVNVFVMVELFYLFNCRSLTKSLFQVGWASNPWILAGVAGMVAAQMLFTYVPFMNRLFHSEPIGLDAWWRILLTGAATYLIVGLEKWLRRLVVERRTAREAFA